MNLKKVRDLDIAKNSFGFSSEIKESLDYNKWIEFIDSQLDYFTWRENTAEGIETLNNINQIPESFREGVLQGLNKVVAYSEYNQKKGYYDLNVGFSKENKRIRISFERPPTIKELKRFFSMANHLDALLLKDGKEIIDEKIIESLT
jgi:hypothetical protein